MNAIATVPATKPNATASHQRTAMSAKSKAAASSVATVSFEKIIVAVPYVGSFEKIFRVVRKAAPARRATRAACLFTKAGDAGPAAGAEGSTHAGRSTCSG